MAGAGDKFSGFSGRPTGGVPGFFGSKAAVTSTPSSERRLRARRGQTDADQALAALRPLPGARCTFDLEGRHLSRNIGTTAPRLCLVAALAGDRGSPRAGDCKPLLTSVKSLAAPALSIAVARCLITSGKMLDRCISPVATDLRHIVRLAPDPRGLLSCFLLSSELATQLFLAAWGIGQGHHLEDLPCARQCRSWRGAWPSTNAEPSAVDTLGVGQSGAHSRTGTETLVPME
jgi:hypothetical protein